jgi:uncharacterized membrane protein YqiK
MDLPGMMGGEFGTFLGVLILAALVLVLLSKTSRYIPNNRVGIVEKLISGRGSVKSGLIALAGEAGFQPEVLRGGWHFFPPFMYRIHKVFLVTIAQSKIGYVFARDGQDLPPTQTLASNDAARGFQDVRAFLQAGGQKGPQRMLLREGTYAINLAQFVVLTEDQLYYLPLDKSELDTFTKMAAIISERGGFRPVIIRGTDDAVGIVTVHDGPSLPSGEIIAPTVGQDQNQPLTYHNNFQDADKFLKAGGFRGRQYQVMVDGTYYINRLFATVELIPKTVVEVGSVGVVVSYTGEAGPDISGAEYRHGELVAPGQRGVWSDPLLPGKYAFNTYAGKVLLVPTTNFILKWNKSEVGSHKFDENPQLRSRQIANEQVETYTRQESAAVKERELREAEAKAKQQTLLTESEISINVQSNAGKADYARAQQQAAQIQTLASAEAEKVRLMGEGEAKRIKSLAEAEAEKAARVGIAQAMAIEEQVRAYGGPQFQLVQQVMNRFAEAIQASQVDVVPKIQMTGSAGGGSLVENLLGVLLSDRVGELAGIAPGAARDPAAQALRDEMMARMARAKDQK